MTLPELLPVLVTAVLGGLLGGGHCFGMCAGIAGGLGAMTTGRGAWVSALLFNVGRISSYAVLGALAGTLLGVTGEAIGVPAWGRILRLLTAALIAAVGMRFLFDWQGLARIERLGAGLWSRVAPLAHRAASRPGLSGRLALGLCWGFLPCGLVYTFLLTAASTGSPTGGMLTMAAFGLGTMPALLGMTLWAPALAGFLGETSTRRLVGVGLLLLAAWTVFVTAGLGGHGGAHHAHHH